MSARQPDIEQWLRRKLDEIVRLKDDAIQIELKNATLEALIHSQETRIGMLEQRKRTLENEVKALQKQMMMNVDFREKCEHHKHVLEIGLADPWLLRGFNREIALGLLAKLQHNVFEGQSTKVIAKSYEVLAICEDYIAKHPEKAQ